MGGGLEYVNFFHTDSKSKKKFFLGGGGGGSGGGSGDRLMDRLTGQNQFAPSTSSKFGA